MHVYIYVFGGGKWEGVHKKIVFYMSGAGLIFCPLKTYRFGVTEYSFENLSLRHLFMPSPCETANA